MDRVEDEVVGSGEGLTHAASAPAEEPAAADEVKETEAAEETKETKKPVDLFADEKKTDMTPFLVIAGVLGLAVVIFLIAWALRWNNSTAIYLIGLTFIPLLLWLGRKTNTVYVVLLGCVIAVLMTCVYCLWTVLAWYHFDVKASQATQRVSMAQPVDRGGQLAIRDAG
ncbi:MAG: hypothetical protein WCB27_07320 [Thermoguttaceae bacterium]